MSSGRVLVVDDSPEDRYILMQAFKDIGFKHKVDVARDGQEALDYLLGNPDLKPKPEPALAILDLKMPRVSGLEVLRAVRERNQLRHLVFIILSSSGERRDRAEAAALGATTYFTKPDDYEGYVVLAKRIAALLDDGQT